MCCLLFLYILCKCGVPMLYKVWPVNPMQNPKRTGGLKFDIEIHNNSKVLSGQQ